MKILGRILFFLLIWVYLVVTVPGAMSWARMKAVRTQDLSILPGLVETARQKHDFARLQQWIAMRPRDESARLLEVVPPFAAELPPGVFFDLANRAYAMGDTDAQRFWMIYGRFRLRYDLLRCGVPDTVEIVNTLSALFAPDQTSMTPVEKDPLLMASYIERAMDFDANYPARNDPKTVCDSILKMKQGKYMLVPEDQWAQIRHVLRIVTEHSLEKMKNKASQGTKSGDAP